MVEKNPVYSKGIIPWYLLYTAEVRQRVIRGITLLSDLCYGKSERVYL